MPIKANRPLAKLCFRNPIVWPHRSNYGSACNSDLAHSLAIKMRTVWPRGLIGSAYLTLPNMQSRRARSIYGAESESLVFTLAADCYATADIAGINALQDINGTSIKENREYAGWVYRTSAGWYSYTAPRPGSFDSSNSGGVLLARLVITTHMEQLLLGIEMKISPLRTLPTASTEM